MISWEVGTVVLVTVRRTRNETKVEFSVHIIIVTIYYRISLLGNVVLILKLWNIQPFLFQIHALMLFWRVYTYWLPSSSFIVMRISRWRASEATSFKILFWKSANSPREWSLSANLSWKRLKNSSISEAARKIPLAVRIELRPRINSHTKPSLYWNQYSEEEKKVVELSTVVVGSDS